MSWARTMMPPMPPDSTTMNPPDRHAYVMAGTKTLFLCHLTMLWMEEHMYQVVLRARLPDYAMDQYVWDSKTHPEETYFLGNDAHDLLAVPELQTGARQSFLGSVWRGIPDKPHYDEWPWKDVEPIIANVPVTVERVVYYRHFDFNLGYPSTLTYVLFGSGSEAHLYHYQTREPDFDQVVSLSEAPLWLSPVILEAGVHVNVPSLPNAPSGKPVYCSNPLTQSKYSVQYAGSQATYVIAVGRCLWFSTKITNHHDPCPTTPAEKRWAPGRESTRVGGGVDEESRT